MSFYFNNQFQKDIYKINTFVPKDEKEYSGVYQRLKREMSPHEVVIYNLSKELNKYTFEDRESKNYLQNIAKKIDQLDYMNMAYLAGALALMYYLKIKQPHPNMFENNKWKLDILPILPLGSNKENISSKEQEIKQQEQILVYIYKIYNTTLGFGIQDEEEEYYPEYEEEKYYPENEEEKVEYEYEDEDLEDLDENMSDDLDTEF